MITIALSRASNTNFFFTSDLHFGHRNVIHFCNRDATDMKDMENKIIERWNSKVTNLDYVFVLGDLFWFGHSVEVKRVLKRLKAKKIYIVPGNHDTHDFLTRVGEWDERVEVLPLIANVNIQDGDNLYKFVLSHYPLLTWPRRKSYLPDGDFHRAGDVYNLFGHVHSTEEWVSSDGKCPYAWDQMDVGCDSNNLYPYSLAEVMGALSLQEKEQANLCTLRLKK